VAIGISALVLLLVRLGVNVPIVTETASPLLAERERTYQLETILAWLHRSNYCDYEVAFAENPGNPIDSVENAITRRNRPPAPIGDVRFFWDTVLRCDKGERPNSKAGTATVTFGGPLLSDSRRVFEVKGKYAGGATVWVQDFQK
jgi:hypothetical protein